MNTDWFQETSVKILILIFHLSTIKVTNFSTSNVILWIRKSSSLKGRFDIKAPWLPPRLEVQNKHSQQLFWNSCNTLWFHADVVFVIVCWITSKGHICRCFSTFLFRVSLWILSHKWWSIFSTIVYRTNLPVFMRLFYLTETAQCSL